MNKVPNPEDKESPHLTNQFIIEEEEYELQPKMKIKSQRSFKGSKLSHDGEQINYHSLPFSRKRRPATGYYSPQKYYLQTSKMSSPQFYIEDLKPSPNVVIGSTDRAGKFKQFNSNLKKRGSGYLNGHTQCLQEKGKNNLHSQLFYQQMLGKYKKASQTIQVDAKVQTKLTAVYCPNVVKVMGPRQRKKINEQKPKFLNKTIDQSLSRAQTPENLNIKPKSRSLSASNKRSLKDAGIFGVSYPKNSIDTKNIKIVF